jgi:RNA polymerase sigma factor (sigma-70 family)
MPPNDPRAADEVRLVADLVAARQRWEDTARNFFDTLEPFLTSWLADETGVLGAEEGRGVAQCVLKWFLSRPEKWALRPPWGGLVALLTRRALEDAGQAPAAAQWALPGEADDVLVLGRPAGEWLAELRRTYQSWQDAATDCHRAYQPGVLAALRQGWPANPDVEDAVQSAFAAFFREGLSSYDPSRVPLFHYLSLLARRKLHDLHRKDQRRRHAEKGYADEPEAARAPPSPEEAVECADWEAAFRATLGSEEKQIFDLHQQGKLLKEIAAVVHLSLATVSRRLEELKRRFRVGLL